MLLERYSFKTINLGSNQAFFFASLLRSSSESSFLISSFSSFISSLSELSREFSSINSDSWTFYTCSFVSVFDFLLLGRVMRPKKSTVNMRRWPE